MTLRPDPTFHASPKLAMEAPPESFAYTLLLSPDFSKPDALAVIDVKPGSPTFSQIVHTVTMPNKGDEFHHFGWNACSSSLSPLTGHAFLERRYLIIPGIRSSRIYIVDTKPDPTKAKIHKIIEPEEVFKKDRLLATAHGSLRAGGHLRQHARWRRQGWHRRTARRLHHGL
jgi:methanethiol oxidase